MIIWLISSVVCFLLLRNFTSKLEIDDHGWKAFKAPLWMWFLAAIVCLVPIANIMGLIGVELLAIADTKSRYPDIRFKEGKSHWLIKLIDFMNKEF